MNLMLPATSAGHDSNANNCKYVLVILCSSMPFIQLGALVCVAARLTSKHQAILVKY